MRYLFKIVITSLKEKQENHENQFKINQLLKNKKSNKKNQIFKDKIERKKYQMTKNN